MIVAAAGLTPRQQVLKRTFDVVVSSVGLVLVGWLIPVLVWLARRDTGTPGLLRHERIGLDGRRFEVLKIRTMAVDGEDHSSVTVRDDPRITALGARLRRWKLDELPQLWNVLRGDMSVVGPRPDVPGYYDQLDGDDRVLLTVRPGITSPAAVHFRDEERLLAEQPDPQTYNDEVLFPRKVSMNREWVEAWTLAGDIACIRRTLAAIRR